MGPVAGRGYPRAQLAAAQGRSFSPEPGVVGVAPRDVEPTIPAKPSPA